MCSTRPPFSGFDHLASRGLRDEQVTAQVEVHDPVPLVLRILLGGVQGSAGAAADGIDHDVEAAKVVGGLIDRLVDVVLLGDISVEEKGLRPNAPDLLLKLGGLLRAPAQDGDLRAVSCKRQGQPTTDCPGAARYDRHLAVDTEARELVGGRLGHGGQNNR